MADRQSDEHGGEEPSGGAVVPTDRRPNGDDFFPNPTAGMVVLRVLAMSARTFLLNDADGRIEQPEADSGSTRCLTH